LKDIQPMHDYVFKDLHRVRTAEVYRSNLGNQTPQIALCNYVYCLVHVITLMGVKVGARSPFPRIFQFS